MVNEKNVDYGYKDFEPKHMIKFVRTGFRFHSWVSEHCSPQTLDSNNNEGLAKHHGQRSRSTYLSPLVAFPLGED